MAREYIRAIEVLEARDALIGIRVNMYPKISKAKQREVWDSYQKIAFPKFSDAPKEEASIDAVLRQLTGGKFGK